MRVPGAPDARLTYCTNVHPAESWPEVEAVIRGPVCDVKSRVAAGERFGVGLRLSALAASELERGPGLEWFRGELHALGLDVFTLNGFPYGRFHGTRVKERVYRPDWLEPERVEYTAALARVLAAVLPDGEVGSISTVPGCFKARGGSARARRTLADNVARAAAELVRIERASGKELCLALEPEPACELETTAEAIAFFEQELCSAEVLAGFARLADIPPERAEPVLRRHVGVCLDACHAAVEFERPRAALGELSRAGIRVPKIQVSAGLVVRRLDPEALAALRPFADDTYLHQVVIRTPAGLERFVDLDDAIARAPALPAECEWRVHFHVPVFEDQLGPFSSTQAELSELLAAPETLELVPHFEVETYTFGVLPERYRAASLVEAIAREIDWTRDVLAPRAAPATP